MDLSFYRDKRNFPCGRKEHDRQSKLLLIPSYIFHCQDISHIYKVLNLKILAFTYF